MSVAFPLEIFYDGSCPVCAREMAVYQRKNPRGRLFFIDISSDDFDAARYGKTRQELMEKMHVRDANGDFTTGVDAFMSIWQAFPSGSPWRVTSALIGLPGVHLLARVAYRIFARNRHLLPKRRDDCPDGRCDLNHPH